MHLNDDSRLDGDELEDGSTDWSRLVARIKEESGLAVADGGRARKSGTAEGVSSLTCFFGEE